MQMHGLAAFGTRTPASFVLIPKLPIASLRQTHPSSSHTNCRTVYAAAELAESSVDVSGSLDEAFDTASTTTEISPSTFDPTLPFGGVKVGDIVCGKVIWSSDKGARVALLKYPGVTGYVPAKEGPVAIRDSSNTPTRSQQEQQRNGGPCIARGLVREWMVLAVPEADAEGKQGPLLGARGMDGDLLWYRLQQICDASMAGRENIKVTVDGANSGGLVSRIGGIPLFIPVSQLEKKDENSWWTEPEMVSTYRGKEINVAVTEVSRGSRKVLGSLSKAGDNDSLRGLKVGSLVSGRVRRIESFGVFVGLQGTKHSGLLHISNISRQHVDRAQAVFELGEEITCLVMGLDPDYSNISLSTAELEPEDGMLLTDKEAVWAAAEDQAQYFRDHLKELESGGFDFEGYYESSLADEGR